MKRIAAVVLGLALAAVSASAANFTYSETTDTTTQWSAGTSWSATPVSAADTVLVFTGSLAAGTNVVSNNDISGNFLLNRINFTYAGPSSGTAPTVTISGNPLEFTGTGATVNYNPSGTANASRARLFLNSDLVLSSDLTILAAANTTLTQYINGTISGPGSLTFSWSAGAPNIFVLSNSSNSYSGDTRLLHSSTTGRDYFLRLGASGVIPNGAGKGNLYFNNTNEANGAVLELAGFSEQINGLSSNNPARNSGTMPFIVRNTSSTPATLTLGDNDASATYYGLIQDGTGGGALSLTKIGSGTQVFAGSAPTYSGNTTISNGALKIDFTQRATSNATTAANYFSPNSNLILAGGTTFAIEGRRDGADLDVAGVTLPRGNRTFYLPNAIASQLVVGQVINITKVSGAGTPPAQVFLTAILGSNATHTEVAASARVSDNAGDNVSDLDIVGRAGVTTQTIKSLTLAGDADSIHYLDFGTSGNVTLTINAAPSQLTDGSKLRILNWAGTPLTGGGSDRLLFLGTPSEFEAVFSQSEVEFDGHPVGYVTIPGTGIYEVVAIPEPGTIGVLLSGLALLALRRRFRG